MLILGFYKILIGNTDNKKRILIAYPMIIGVPTKIPIYFLPMIFAIKTSVY